MINSMTNTLNDNEKFKTSDFGLATALVTLGFGLETLEKENPAKVIFVFKKSKKLEQVIKQYFSNQLQVNPQLLFSSQRTLKTYLR